MSTFSRLNDCWYLTKQGTVGVAAREVEEAASRRQSHDAAGNPH
jgi:hypothetical protein